MDDDNDKYDDEERYGEIYTSEGAETAEDTWPDDEMDHEADQFDPRYFDTDRNPELGIEVSDRLPDENFDDGLDEPEEPGEPFA